MAVVATAGHVDHGKSTLVRLLTGQEPDRWAEERRRGLTIDLGYAWTDIDGRRVSLVDVPGHEHFTGNMLAGLGPVHAVLFVVAADDGWSAQSREHARAIAALGIRHVLLVVTRCDLAPGEPARTESLAELGRLGIPVAESVLVSGATGAGIPELRVALGRLAAAASPSHAKGELAPADEGDSPGVRLWVDRSFTVRGAGTVATGTLAAGRIAVGDQLLLAGRPVTVRGLQTCGAEVPEVVGPARVAVNLRGVEVKEVGRGTALTGLGWPTHPAVLDIELRRLDATTATGQHRLPRQLTLHAGTAAVPVRTQQLGDGAVRLRLAHPLAVVVGDRAVLRDPGRHEVVGGVAVRAVDPPTRRPVRRDRADHAAYPGLVSAPQWRAGTQEQAGVEDPSAGVRSLLAWLGEHPLQAPSRADLDGWAVTPADLAAAAGRGAVLRLGGVLLGGDALARAEGVVRGLPQPFGVGDAARAMGTSRRVAVPLLERLDASLVTRRLADGTREVRERG
ncbi:selenocysteine-specific translation elongation factor SelB [Pedococcus dokdonensis]|uniref:Selenocysteine-specific translation elongation factor SelB n=1 Tax=Pedococcus dokdonensis TaxID=443156 RepID=A0A1H0TK36_9MICO|nr:selenocysteine-specific translation elongation factor [Pedococcus dokdonensis]SDP54359.1 selenocysteine-specific translation elongation factor SelB [Pedococcus dokdonensis]